MQFKFYTIPAGGSETSVFEEELNHFIRSHRVLSVKREFASDGTQSRWCICVEYMDGADADAQGRTFWQAKERVDYREILSEEEFARFAKMRSVRKTIAENDHIPAYAIMKDEMLAELSKVAEVDEKTLKALPGFGDRKFEKYGSRFLDMLIGQRNANETGGKSVPSDQ